MRWRLVLAVLGLWSIGGPVQAASFDCRKATKPHEQIICGDPALSAADDALAQAYGQLLAALPTPLKQALQKSQRSWLTYGPLACSSDGRGTIKDKAAFTQCLQTEYASRLTTLKRQPVQIGAFKTLAVTDYQAMASSSTDPEFFPVVTHDKTITLVFDGDAEVATQLNRWLQTLAATDKAGWNDPDTSASFAVALAQVNAVFASALLSNDIFGVGAAHPLSTASAAHLVTATGKPLMFRDVLGPTAGPKLTALSWAALKKKLGNDMLVDKPTQIAKLVNDPGHWRFSADGLTIAFNVYEVAAYVMGPQEITVPWAALGGVLTPLGQSIAAAAR